MQVMLMRPSWRTWGEVPIINVLALNGGNNQTSSREKIGIGVGV